LENVLGGSADDLITGSVANNTMAGGPGDDIYYFKNDWGYDVVIELLNEGTDTMNFSQVTVPLTFTLGSIVVTDGTNIAIHLENNVENLIAGTGGNTLVGPDNMNIWIITGENEGTVDGIFFTGMENLVGGSDVDIFIFSPAGEITGTVSGGAGSDSIYAPVTVNTWNIVGTNEGIIPGMVHFTEMENLFAGSGDDTFYFSDGAGVTGIIDGDGGYNTLNYSAYTTPVTVNLDTSTATGCGVFDDIDRIIGGSVKDNLIGPNSPETWDIVGNDEINVFGMEFESFENLTGGTADDTFEFSDGAGVTGLIDGGDGSNILDYSAYTTKITVDLENLTATGCGGFANISQIIGGTISDDIIGPNVDNTWNITGSDEIDVLGIEFTSFENLFGGTKNDTYNFSDGAGVTGIIDGGDGLDTLNYSAYSSNITVNLETNTATGTAGAYDIEKVIGGSGSDTLIGPNSANAWSILSTNKGEIPGIIEFDNIENLVGGNAQDIFVFSDGANVIGTIEGNDGLNEFDYSLYTTAVIVDLELGTATGTGGFFNITRFYGGTASDTFIGPNATMNWYIIGADSVNMEGDIHFEDFENLTGGNENDTFVFSALGSVTGHIDGQGGNNTLDYYDYPALVIVSLGAGTATGTGGISNIQNVIGSQSATNILIGNEEDNILVGGNLADILVSGDGNDILLGGGGDDDLVGGNGRDIVAGGEGEDDIYGDAGDDILISGTTSYDDITDSYNLTAWVAFRVEWSSNLSYNDRINNTRDVGVGPYNYTLDPGVTVFDDGVGDDLFGGVDLDWFFVGVGDFDDSEPSEQVEVL
jgi:Ca2+-binding RTX toxin-like protein